MRLIVADVLKAQGWVKVVRCKDCIYWCCEVNKTTHWVCKQHSYDSRLLHTTPDFYCADGKLRDGGAEEKGELKEQNQVELLKQIRDDCKAIAPIIVNGEYECGECRYELRSNADTYCPCCGRKVKWDGETP